MPWSNSFRQDSRSDYLSKVFKASVEAADAVRSLAEDKSFEQNKQGLSKTEWLSILFEFIYFYLHLTDRLAFGRLSEEKRGTFMTKLEEICISSAVNTTCDGWPKSKKDKIRKECMQNFFTSMEEYSRYQELFPKKGEGSKNTLFWEFGKNIAKLAGREMSTRYIMLSTKMAVDSLVVLDTKSFIEKVT